MCCECIFDLCGCLPVLWFFGVIIPLATLGLIGVLAYFIGYSICLAIPQLAISPMPSAGKFFAFAVFGSMFSTALFFIIVGIILCHLLKTRREPINKYERLRRRYRKCRYTAFAMILAGPFWGGMIGVLGGLNNRSKKLGDGHKIDIEFGKGALVGVIGGAVFLAAIGGLFLVWTSWKRARLSFKFTEKEKTTPDPIPEPEPDVEKGKDVEEDHKEPEGDQKEAEGGQKEVGQPEGGKIRDVEYGRKSTDIEHGMQTTGIEYGQKKDLRDGPPSNFMFE